MNSRILHVFSQQFRGWGGRLAANVCCAAVMLVSFGQPFGARAASNSASPEWTKNLIIYEVAPRGFTSPNGPESGNFTSLKEKMPYLADLGINGIWLAGHALADSHHFYNIWTTYASIDVSQLDPSLGTAEEFKAMIDEAHRHGIKVFLDVLTTGVMGYSPVRKQHPNWFDGETWGLATYDWYGGHADFDAWWVKVWSDYIIKYGVDGFRLDSEIMRPDLYARIRANAAAAGREIAVFEESDAPIPGVTDFVQHESMLSGAEPGNLIPSLVQDIPMFYATKFGKAGHYRVDLQYSDDGSRVAGDTNGQGTLQVRVDGLTADKTTRRSFVYYAPLPDGIPDMQLTVKGVASKPIENIDVYDDQGGDWSLHPRLWHRYLAIGGTDPTFALSDLAPPTGAAGLQLYVATLGHGYPSLQLSCHDNGWEGFPGDKNPYVAQGSRALFGYSLLFTPTIPLFFSGEEFDADFKPLPGLSPHLFGGSDAGKGRWLYGAQLDWSDLQRPEHHAMFADVKKMIAVRRQEADILAVLPDQRRPHLVAVPHEGDIAVPVPYVRWNERGAIVVAANRNADQDAHLKLRIPLQEIGLAGHARYTVTELWPEGRTEDLSEGALSAYACTVKRDRTVGGGLRVVKIEPKP